MSGLLWKRRNLGAVVDGVLVVLITKAHRKLVLGSISWLFAHIKNIN
jgi:hypothetical protein